MGGLNPRTPMTNGSNSRVCGAVVAWACRPEGGAGHPSFKTRSNEQEVGRGEGRGGDVTEMHAPRSMLRSTLWRDLPFARRAAVVERSRTTSIPLPDQLLARRGSTPVDFNTIHTID